MTVGCAWCSGPRDDPARNSRGERCPCRCHTDTRDCLDGLFEIAVMTPEAPG